MKFGQFIFLFLFSCTAFAQDYFPIIKEGKWGAIDKKGTQTIPFKYKSLSAFSLQNLAIAETAEGKGLIDQTGKEILPFVFQKIQPLENGQAIVWKNFMVGVFTLENKEIISTDYDFITFENGLFYLKKEGKYGVALPSGQLVLETAYHSIGKFSSNGLALIQKEAKYGLINTLGEVVAEPIYDRILFEEGYILAHQENARTKFVCDAQGRLLDAEHFVNQKAFELGEKKLLAQKLVEEARTNPEVKKLRWVQKGGAFTLENALGSNVLSHQQFYWVNQDEKTLLSMAKTVDHEGVEHVSLIDGENGKFLFTKENVIDFSVTDFSTSNWARCASDTTWDAIISKEGELVKAFLVDGKELKIKNVGEFHEGKAWVQFSNKLYGYIDANAEIIVKPTFERAGDFYSGLAVFREDKKFGVVNTKGEILIKPTYTSISNYENGLFRVENEAGLWGAINAKGSVVIPISYNEIGPFSNGKAYVVQNGLFGLINQKGTLLFAPQIECDFMGEFKNGIAPIYRGKYVHHKGKEAVIRYRTLGYVKENGQILVEPIYTSIHDFDKIWSAKRGVARIVKGRTFGYINYNGNIVLDAIYERIENYEQVWEDNTNIARVQKNGLTGFVDYNGNEVLPIQYQGVTESFKDVWKKGQGLAKAKKNDRYGFVNHQGKVVIPFAYTSVSEMKGGIIIVEQDGKWGAVDSLHQEVLPIKYSGVKFIEHTQPQLLKVYTEASASYRLSVEGMLEPIEENAVEVAEGKLTTEKYQFIRPYDENGLAIAEINKKGRNWQAVINKEGKALTKFIYKKIGIFSDGMAFVQVQSDKSSERKYGFINLRGEEVIAPTFTNAQDFADGTAPVMQRGKWGYIDLKGSFIIPIQFMDAMPFSGGYAVVNKKEIIDSTGKKVGIFLGDGEITSSFQENRAIVTGKNGLQYHITPTGKTIYEAQFDEVTAFYSHYAFAKKGEVWQITRQRDKKDIYKVQMSKQKYTEYINQFGTNRSIKTGDGHVLKDIKFEKIVEGTWRLMTKDGTYPNDATFNELGKDAQGFWVKLNRFTGVTNAKGEILVAPKCEIVKRVSEDVIRIEHQGKISYMSTDGTWIWNE